MSTTDSEEVFSCSLNSNSYFTDHVIPSFLSTSIPQEHNYDREIQQDTQTYINSPLMYTVKPNMSLIDDELCSISVGKVDRMSKSINSDIKIRFANAAQDSYRMWLMKV